MKRWVFILAILYRGTEVHSAFFAAVIIVAVNTLSIHGGAYLQGAVQKDFWVIRHLLGLVL